MSQGETAHELRSRLRLKGRLALEGFLVGVVAGLVIVVFRLGVEWLQHLIKAAFGYSVGHWTAALGLFFLFSLFGLFAGWLAKKEPMISGSGIPQVAGQLAGLLHFKWYRVLPAKVLGGLLTLGSGLTMGREGPSVQMGACCGEAVATLLKRPQTEHKYLISTGAASGLAAAFSAPLSGVVFALEEVHKNFSVLALISAMTGAVTADFITKTIFGLKPELALKIKGHLPLERYWVLIILGIVIGLGAWLFNHAIVAAKKLYAKLPVSQVIKGYLPFAISFFLILVDPALFGSGQTMIHWVDHGGYAIGTLAFYYIAKLLLLLLCFGSGLPGGIFFPLLVLGSLLGHLYGLVFAELGIIEPDHVIYYAVLAMAGHFAGIVRAPVTGILLICEMTGSFEQLLPLTVISLVSYLTIEQLRCEPIYESLLHLILKDRKSPVLHNEPELDVPSNRVLLEYAVVHNSAVDGHAIRDIAWPENMLIVAVKRRGREILPRGYISLKGGDYLVVLLKRDEHGELDSLIKGLCCEECFGCE